MTSFVYSDISICFGCFLLIDTLFCFKLSID
uniref:Uncharacterized protein n=1 Tax=Musa acuminata subsp. malaccensis TaxID=214687 RepID=A0A804K0B0_MUSAM